MSAARDRGTRKVTITVPEDVAATLDGWKADGRIESVSAFVAETVRARIDRAQSLAKIEEISGGRPPLELINRARAMQGLPPLPDDKSEGPRAGAA